MTTLQLPEEEITRHPPGSAGGGQRRLRWLRDGWSDAAERAGRRWAVLVWGLTLAALLAQDPGRMTFDTKLGVNIDPVGFYQRLWHLWNPLEWLGSLQDQYIGYAFPMGVFYLTAHVLHVPVWVAERIWMSLLVSVAFLGIVRLAEALGIGSRPTRLLAGATFALWPTFTILIGSTSAAVLPGVLAPWAVLPLIRARSARRAAAGSALIVACMGGVNATATLAALVLPGMYVPDPARPAPVGTGRLVAPGGPAGHVMVAGAAAVPGQVRLQLPALHRAVRATPRRPCRRPRRCAAAATGSRT